MDALKPDFNRLKKVLLREGEPDRVPFFDLYPDASMIQAITGKPMGVDTNMEFFYSMGYDYVYVEANFRYRMLRNFTDDLSTLSREKRGFVDNNSGIIENRRDFDSYEWPSVDASAAYAIRETAKNLPCGMKMVADWACGGILESVMHLMGYVPFSYALYEDEQLVWDMFEKIGTDHIGAMKVCLESVDLEKIGAISLGDDMGYNHSTMISPELLRKYVFPWQKRLAELAHNFGLPFILHSCGNLESVMDDLIDYVGIDAKHSFEDKILPVSEAKRKYGRRVALLGGVDLHFLCTKSDEEVRGYVDNIIASCAPGGGYALGTGNSIANYIPVKNYLAMLDEGRKKGVYPIPGIGFAGWKAGRIDY